MNYFTKYLPVEGEIKEEDNAPVMRNGKFTRMKLKGRMDDLRALEGFKMGHYKPAKLFLCNRDIEVGDTVKNINRDDIEFTVSKIEMGSGENYFPKELLVWYEHNGINYWLFAKNCYKVLGEVSPDALSYVKEGDEFTSDQVQHNHICHDFPGNDGYCFHCHRSRKCDSTDFNYKIKGPCGHFH